jgi:hypothetical protein
MRFRTSIVVVFLASILFMFSPLFGIASMQTKAAASYSQIMAWADEEYVLSEWLTDNFGASIYSTYAWYFIGRGISGLVYLYQATGDTTYIDGAIALANRHISEGEDIDSDGYLEWAGHPTNTDWSAPLWSAMAEWRGNMGLGTLLGVLATDPNLSSYSSYKNTLQQFLEVQAWDKWTIGNEVAGRDCDQINETWVVSHFVARCEHVALNLYLATGQEEYLNHVTVRANALKNAFVLNANNSYSVYSYMDQTGDFADLEHMTDTIQFINAAYKAGIVFNSTDITRFVNTFKLNFWNGNLATPDFNLKSDGSGGLVSAQTPSNRSVGMWAQMSEYDSQIADIVSNYYSNGNHWDVPVAKISFLGSLALGYYGEFTQTSSSSSTTTSSSSSVSLPALTATSGYTKYPITVDGVLSEGIWNVAPSVSFSNSGRSNNTMNVKTLWDNTNIYIGAKVTDSSLETGGGSEIYYDDAVEIFFDTLNNNSTNYDSDDYHAIVNIAGASYQYTDLPAAYQTVTGGGGYVTEMRISWADLGVTPSQGLGMGYLVVNDDRDGGVSSVYDWIGMVNVYGQDFKRTDQWGTITLGGSTQKRGDYTFDDHVSLPDFSVFAANYKVSSIDCLYDLVGDNCYLDIGDFQEFASNYGS